MSQPKQTQREFKGDLGGLGGLGGLLALRKKADQVYRLTCRIENLHAVQGRNDGTTKLERRSIEETTDTTFAEGVPDGAMASPKSRRRGRTADKSSQIPTYRFERNGKPDEISLEIGGPYGLLGKALRDAIVAKGKEKYWLAGSSLIHFRPVNGATNAYVAVKASTTISAADGDNGHDPRPRMEARNSRGGGQVMVPVFHERLREPIRVVVDMVVSAECPRSTEEVAGLLHAMQGVPLGPARRGRLMIEKVESIR